MRLHYFVSKTCISTLPGVSKEGLGRVKMLILKTKQSKCKEVGQNKVYVITAA